MGTIRIGGYSSLDIPSGQTNGMLYNVLNDSISSYGLPISLFRKYIYIQSYNEYRQ